MSNDNDHNPSALAHINIKQLSVISFRFLVLWAIQIVASILGMGAALFGALFDFPYIFLLALLLLAVIFCITIPYNIFLVGRFERTKHRCLYYTTDKRKS